MGRNITQHIPDPKTDAATVKRGPWGTGNVQCWHQDNEWKYSIGFYTILKTEVKTIYGRIRYMPGTDWCIIALWFVHTFQIWVCESFQKIFLRLTGISTPWMKFFEALSSVNGPIIKRNKDYDDRQGQVE